MRRIVYTRPDGGLSIVIPVINTLPRLEDISEAAAEQRAWDKLPLDAINPRFVTVAEIPTDRTFRDALKSDLTHDMVKCREIHKNKLRALRALKFEPLERAQRTALAVGDGTTALQVEKKLQALRDVTSDPRIAAATTPEELKGVIPAVLA